MRQKHVGKPHEPANIYNNAFSQVINNNCNSENIQFLLYLYKRNQQRMSILYRQYLYTETFTTVYATSSRYDTNVKSNELGLKPNTLQQIHIGNFGSSVTIIASYSSPPVIGSRNLPAKIHSNSRQFLSDKPILFICSNMSIIREHVINGSFSTHSISIYTCRLKRVVAIAKENNL